MVMKLRLLSVRGAFLKWPKISGGSYYLRSFLIPSRGGFLLLKEERFQVE